MSAGPPPEPPLVVPELPAGPFLLRPWRDDDVDLVHDASSDPFIPLITTVPAAYTPEEGVAFLQRQRDRAVTGEGYSFVISEADSGRGVGAIGLWLRNADLGRAFLGYWVAPSYRGRRAATHALRAVALWAFRDLGFHRLELWVEPWNTASIASAEAAGFRSEGLLRSWEEVGGERKDMLMFSLLPNDRSA